MTVGSPLAGPMTAGPSPSHLPPGGSVLTSEEYTAFLATEYLQSYVRDGGAGVKLVVVDDAERFAAALTSAATGFVTALVDAAETRVQLIDQVFTEVARQLDWDTLVAAMVTRAYEHAGFDVPPDSPLTVTAVAAHHDVDPAELYRSVRRSLEQLLLADGGLGHDFRVAMLRLGQAALGRHEMDETEHATVRQWLIGAKVAVTRLRSVSLSARVARHNARPLLLSLTRWLRIIGRPGLVLQLDLTRLAVARRPPVEGRDGTYYTKAGVMDAWEMLRQLIDATDDIEAALIVAILPPSLMTDEARGLPAYSALHLRVADEVRDRRRANPFASLVRLGVRLEAVS